MYYGTGTYQTPFTFEGGDLRRRRTLSRQAASLSLNLCRRCDNRQLASRRPTSVRRLHKEKEVCHWGMRT